MTQALSRLLQIIEWLKLQSNKSVNLSALCSQNLKGILHPINYLRGLIFAVSAAPEIPMPEVWFPWVFLKHGQLKDTDQANVLSDALMSELQQQLAAMRDESIGMPADCDYPQDGNPQSALSQFSSGLIAAHTQLEPVWRSAWQRVEKRAPDKLPSMQKDLTHCLLMFSTFSNIPLALQQAEATGQTDLAAKLPTIYLSLNNALATYVGLSGTLVDYLPDQFQTFTQST